MHAKLKKLQDSSAYTSVANFKPAMGGLSEAAAFLHHFELKDQHVSIKLSPST